MNDDVQWPFNLLLFRSTASVNTGLSTHCWGHFPVCQPRSHCRTRPTDANIADNVQESRQKIEEGTKARLADVRDALVSQTHSTVLDVQDRLQKDHNRSKDLQRPLDDELLEITRKDGTVVTMTLGKRIDAYRRLVHREKQNLNSLFEQWQQVSGEINRLATELLGSEGSDNILKGIDAVAPDFDGVEQRALTGRLEAEMERAQAEAAAIGAKAVKQMKTGEKASSRHGNFPCRLID